MSSGKGRTHNPFINGLEKMRKVEDVMDIRISQIKKQSKQALKGYWGTAVLITFIIFLLNAVLPFILEVIVSGGFSKWYEQESPPIVINIVEIIFSIILIPISVTICWFYLNMVRKNEPLISQIFVIYKNGNQILKLIGVSILQGVYILLWSLLLFVPGIIKSLSYSQAYFLLKDHPEYTINQAITESKIRMKGYVSVK